MTEVAQVYLDMPNAGSFHGTWDTVSVCLDCLKTTWISSLLRDCRLLVRLQVAGGSTGDS